MAGQGTVGRDQGGGALRRFQRLAHYQRDDPGFLAQGAAVDAAQAVVGAGCVQLQIPPSGGGRFRPQCGAHQRHAGRAGVARGLMGGLQRPVRHLVAVGADAVQQVFQRVLGMGVGQGRPAVGVHVAVQAGQHDAAGGQPGDHLQQGGGGGDRPGAAGRDHRPGRRVGRPGPGQPGDQAVAPVGRVEAAFGGQQCWPVAGDDGQQVERDLPVGGQRIRGQVGQAVEAQALDLDLVQQVGQLVGQAHGLARRQPPAVGPAAAPPGHDLTGQQQAAALLGDGRRQRVVGYRGVGQAGQHHLLFVHVADRTHARQQQPAHRAPAQERLGQRAHRAPVGQQHDHVGQALGVAAGAGFKSGCQRVGEGHAGGDRKKAWARCRVRRRGHSASMRSAGRIASGVPTWAQRPSCTRPNSRLASCAVSHSRLLENTVSWAASNSRGCSICTPPNR